jgi:hydrogenase expression/formation protein HypE
LLSDLKRILDSMAQTAREAGVAIVTGDTKVVGRGQADGIFINTAGVGVLPPLAGVGNKADAETGDDVGAGSARTGGSALSAANVRPGDVLLVSGSLGDHGMCIVSQREELAFAADIQSDAAPLNHLMAEVLAAAPHTRCFRDPTRGGLASALNEIAGASDVQILVEEERVPVKPAVRGACEMLGYDVFQVANEGKIVAFVPAAEAEAALAAMRANRYGADAAIIGVAGAASGGGSDAGGTSSSARPGSSTRPSPSNSGRRLGSLSGVVLRNAFGATRVMDMLVGEQLPRIC